MSTPEIDGTRSRARPEPSLGYWMRHLDEASCRVAAGFAIRFSTLAAVTTSPCLLGFRPLGDVVGALQLACAVGALFAVGRAARHQAPLGGATLNAWDEALAFWAAGLLLHWLARFV